MSAFDTATQSLFNDPHCSEVAIYQPSLGPPVSLHIVVTRGATLIGDFNQTLGGRMIVRVRNVDAIIDIDDVIEINSIEYRIAQILNDTGYVQELLLSDSQ